MLLCLWQILLPSLVDAQASRRRRIEFDYPPNRIERMVVGTSRIVDIPFHTTGDVRAPQVALWVRGPTIVPVTPPQMSDIPAFTSSWIAVRLTVPPRTVPGRYEAIVRVTERRAEVGTLRVPIVIEAAGANTPPQPATGEPPTDEPG